MTSPAQKRMSLPTASIALVASPAESVSGPWVSNWENTLAKDLIDSRIVDVDAEKEVEEACEILLKENILCLAVRDETKTDDESSFIGLFDFSDVNAFLTLAATRHTLHPDDLLENSRVSKIVAAGLEGRVPVKLVSNLSEKNPLEILEHDSTVISLLGVFARGTHRVLIRSPARSSFLGIVSDRSLLSYFSNYAKQTPTLQSYLSNSLHSLDLPSINIADAVISIDTNSTVLDAMRLMDEQGVSSVAVLDELGTLLSAVSVTDIGRIVVPSQSNQILSSTIAQFISIVKAADGSTDGVDKIPGKLPFRLFARTRAYVTADTQVYSVLPTSSLTYTIEKLLATEAHRVFVTTEPERSSPSSVSSVSFGGNLKGLASIVDILSLFARLANVPDVDPTRMQRHRRASSTSSHSRSNSHCSPKSDSIAARSRSGSRPSSGRV